MAGLAIASFVLQDGGFRFDDDNDNWIEMGSDECDYWVNNYGLPVVPTAGGCKATAANYAIALAKKNYELISPTTTVVSITMPTTTTIETTTMPDQCGNTDASCGTWPNCLDMSDDDICNTGGVYYDYWCSDNVPMVTIKCIDSCCRSWFGADSYCEGDECVYGEGDTATTTIPMQETGEHFLEEGQTVECPTSGYDFCKIEYYRVSDDKLINTWQISLGDSRTTSPSYYYKLFGVVQ